MNKSEDTIGVKKIDGGVKKPPHSGVKKPPHIVVEKPPHIVVEKPQHSVDKKPLHSVDKKSPHSIVEKNTANESDAAGNDKRDDEPITNSSRDNAVSRLDELRNKAINHKRLLDIKRALLRSDIYPFPTKTAIKVFEESHCPCCFQQMFERTKIPDGIKTTLQCGHQLHTMCMLKWFANEESSGRCPVCREKSS